MFRFRRNIILMSTRGELDYNSYAPERSLSLGTPTSPGFERPLYNPSVAAKGRAERGEEQRSALQVEKQNRFNRNTFRPNT